MSQREIMEWDAGKAHTLDAPERELDTPAGNVVELLSLTGSEMFFGLQTHLSTAEEAVT